MDDTEKPRLHHTDYTVAWICALPIETAAAMAMLDNTHQELPVSKNDKNSYTLGNIGAHNIVVVGLPAGVYGTTPAAIAATHLTDTFQLIQFSFMVGVGGGMPNIKPDIRLGDIVVSQPTEDIGGVVQYDRGRRLHRGHLNRTGSLNKPPEVLLKAMNKLQASHMLRESSIPDLLNKMVERWPKTKDIFKYPGDEQDLLFENGYKHDESKDTCASCDRSKCVKRDPRSQHASFIHYGIIGSGNEVIKDAATRDKYAQKYSILCFEMEAAGLMDHIPCLVIRGICDYADSHKNKQWQPYAAARAAAYAKELLYIFHANVEGDTPASLDKSYNGLASPNKPSLSYKLNSKW